ncbi:MAG: AsnC family transcriptional regulator, partial [Saccharolobus sp.]
VFTRKLEIAKKFFSKTLFRVIEDENAGIYVNAVDSMEEARDITLKFKREFDNDAEIMIVTKYDFK